MMKTLFWVIAAIVAYLIWKKGSQSKYLFPYIPGINGGEGVAPPSSDVQAFDEVTNNRYNPK